MEVHEGLRNISQDNLSHRLISTQALRGRVYDVSAGTKFYGPGKAYNHFVGRDASRAFATGCRAAECVSADLDGLSPSQLREVDRWMEMYETHDKYTFVGTLVEDPVDVALDSM